MNKQLKRNKQVLRQFMREHYTDERLAMLLAHAQSGRLAFHSCCCFIGVVTADHALQGAFPSANANHLALARTLPKAYEAEEAFLNLSPDDFVGDDERRRRRLISIIKAEIRRRDRERQGNAVVEDCVEFDLVARQ